MLQRIFFFAFISIALFQFIPCKLFADNMYEISGSPYATDGAPMAERIQSQHEKVIVINPNEHVYGAYDADGKLIRWGIASAGKDKCADTGEHCRTHTGTFRIYFMGNANCYSRKYDSASMPYCMYFNGGEAIHASSEVEFSNISHGCVRVHYGDAEWLRFHFVEGPNERNNYLGTKVIVLSYEHTNGS